MTEQVNGRLPAVLRAWLLLVAGGLAGLLLWCWTPRGRLGPDAPAPKAPPPAEIAAGATGSGSSPGTVAAPTGDRGAATAPLNPPIRQKLSPAALESLVTRWGFDIHQKDVPLLDAATEQALIDRYRATTKIPAKFSIMRVLAYGGSDRSVPLFASALFGEFAGRQVTREEDKMLTEIPVCLGILGHHEPQAVRALLEAAEAGRIQPAHL